MKCPRCGADMKEGQMYCEHCGREIQIVPEFDPALTRVILLFIHTMFRTI